MHSHIHDHSPCLWDIGSFSFHSLFYSLSLSLSHPYRRHSLFLSHLLFCSHHLCCFASAMHLHANWSQLEVDGFIAEVFTCHHYTPPHVLIKFPLKVIPSFASLYSFFLISFFFFQDNKFLQMCWSVVMNSPPPFLSSPSSSSSVKSKM